MRFQCSRVEHSVTTHWHRQAEPTDRVTHGGDVASDEQQAAPGRVTAGPAVVIYQSKMRGVTRMLAALALAVFLLALFFDRTIAGRALRATAVNRVGARLVGIRPASAGAVAFLIASGLAAISGILIGPVNTLFYDSGFVIGLKAFVGAIIGGLVSYPGAALGALFVGLLESYTAFWNSALKEVTVFAVLVPVLILRSALQHGEAGDAEGDEL